jgi:hypothetical protein
MGGLSKIIVNGIWWDKGLCLWASGEQTLLSIELCIQFQVNSLRGLVHGIQDFASGRSTSKNCSVNCVCSCQVNSLHGLVHGIWDVASGCPVIRQCSALNCICSFPVNSLQGLLHGIWDVTSEHPCSTHCLALNCLCSLRSIHYGDRCMGFGILPLGIWGANTALH